MIRVSKRLEKNVFNSELMWLASIICTSKSTCAAHESYLSRLPGTRIDSSNRRATLIGNSKGDW